MRKKGFFSKKKAKTFLKGSPGMPAGMSVAMSSSKSVVYDSLSFLCSIQGITHGFCGFLLILGAVVVVLAGQVLGSVAFCILNL